MKNPSPNDRSPLHHFTVAVSVALILFLAGCASYPMGLTKEQWNVLSPEQQAGYRAQQAEIDAQKRAEAQARFEEKKRLEQERRRQEQERIQAIYANPQYGDIIVVQIAGGEIGIGDKRYPYQPVQFELARGETKRVNFCRQDRPTSFRYLVMTYTEEGKWFIFDNGSRGAIRIENNGWQTGRTYRPEEVQDHQFSSGARNIGIHIGFKSVSP